MGHIAHLRKQFKSLNKYDYIITLIKRRKKKTLWEIIASSFEETWILFTQWCFVPSLVEIGSVVLEKKMKMWKVYRQTDAGWQVIRKAHLSFQLRWAKKLKYNDIYRWLSIAQTLISWSSRSHAVKLWSSFFSLYNKASLLPISRSSQSLELGPGSRYTHFIVFYSQFLKVLIANTRLPIKLVYW